jgi:hypothetical protein
MLAGRTDDMPDEAPALDSGLIHTIRTSASRLIPGEAMFVRQLHADIVPLIPELAADRGWAFCERLVRSVLWAAVTDQPTDVIADTLRWVGATNRMEGFPESGYVSVAHALIRTVRDLSGNNWSTSMGSAWVTYFLWLQPFLMAGARQAAARQQDAARQAAAEKQAERAWAFSQVTRDGPAPVARGDVNVESVADLLDDEDDDDEDGSTGYSQIMSQMTLNPRREDLTLS